MLMASLYAYAATPSVSRVKWRTRQVGQASRIGVEPNRPLARKMDATGMPLHPPP